MPSPRYVRPVMLATQILAALGLLAVCHLAFGALARRCACNPDQPVFVSPAIGLDLSYALLGMLYAGAGPALAALLTAPPFGDPGRRPPGIWLAQAPLALQLVLLLAVTDFAQYWLHRAFHSRRLWPWHAIHHSAAEVNWTTTFRTHPANYLVVNSALAVLARLAGVSETALLLAAPIFFLSGVVTHANLNWTFGPLRHVLASPVFHRWHHCADPALRDRNFAPIFPVWDLMFGTFHLPSDRRPDGYGAEGVPADLLGQLVHPLRPPAA
jgi:sterol desaturase/sphingolipid hydroxylase (fatty acid hydroxylase superfamily)